MGKKIKKPLHLSLNCTKCFSLSTAWNNFMFRCLHILLTTRKMLHLDGEIFFDQYGQHNHKSWHFHAVLYPHTY